MNVSVTIGWTRSALPEYSSFCDGYRPGASQHTETIEIEVGDLTPVGAAEKIAEAVFCATNHPYPEGLVGLSKQAFDAITATGYNGRGAHYSLSVGDTVTVGEVMLSCESDGWQQVSSEVQV